MGHVSIGVEVQRNTDGDSPSSHYHVIAMRPKSMHHASESRFVELGEEFRLPMVCNVIKVL